MNIGDILAMLRPQNVAQNAILAGSGGAGAGTAVPQPGPQLPPNAPVPPGLPPPLPEQPPAQPSVAPQSPPDLSAMYMDMIQDAQRKENLNSGMTMMAAGLTPSLETRQMLLGTLGTGGGGDGMGSVFNALDNIRKTTMEFEQKQKMRATLPAIAKQYGLTMETVSALYEGGQLEEFLKEAQNPETQIVTKPDGSQVLIDSNTGKEMRTVAGAKPREIEYIDDPAGTGGKIAVYKDDKTPVAGGGPVTDIKPVPKQVRTITLADGRIQPIDEQGKPIGEPYGPEEKKQKEIRTLADGTLQAFDEDGKPVGGPMGPKTEVTTDDITEYKEAQKQGYKGTLEDWILSGKKAAATKIDLGLGGGKFEEELARGAAKQYDTEFAEATGAKDTITSIDNARSQLEQGIVAGSLFSPLELTGRKAIASIFGVPDEATTNTEVFQSTLKEVVLGKIKALGAGSGISNTDREFVEKAVGGSIEMNPDSMRRIMDILEKGARNKIRNYNKEVERLISTYSGDEQARMRRILRSVEEPPAKKLTIEERLKKYSGTK